MRVREQILWEKLLKLPIEDLALGQPSNLNLYFAEGYRCGGIPIHSRTVDWSMTQYNVSLFVKYGYYWCKTIVVCIVDFIEHIENIFLFVCL
ncbi:hypothetical protein ACFX13_043140 [Malus domestica]